MRTSIRILWLSLVSAALGMSASVCRAELVVIVAANSPVTTLTENEVADIYLGRTSRLPGGAQVQPIDLADDAANRTTFYRIVCGKSPAQLRAYWSKLIFTGGGQPPREATDAEAMKRLVAGGPNSIGYIDRSQLDATVKPVLALH
jgi:ABC-type phosphate transport system substrate-binding protein